jgi:hypothetical protein
MILFPGTTRHIALFLCPYTLSRGPKGANYSQKDTETCWPWASMRWRHMVCEKTKNYFNDVIQCWHFYCFILYESYIIDVQPPTILNPLNPTLNPICYLLTLLAHHFLHVSRIRVKSLALRLLMSYMYGAPILDVSRSYTTTQHSR